MSFCRLRTLIAAVLVLGATQAAMADTDADFERIRETFVPPLDPAEARDLIPGLEGKWLHFTVARPGDYSPERVASTCSRRTNLTYTLTRSESGYAFEMMREPQPDLRLFTRFELIQGNSFFMISDTDAEMRAQIGEDRQDARLADILRPGVIMNNLGMVQVLLPTPEIMVITAPLILPKIYIRCPQEPPEAGAGTP